MTTADALRELLALLDSVERKASRLLGQKSGLWPDLKRMRAVLTRLMEGAR